MLCGAEHAPKVPIADGETLGVLHETFDARHGPGPHLMGADTLVGNDV